MWINKQQMPNETNRRMQINATVPLAITAATMVVMIIPLAHYQQQPMKWTTILAALFIVGWIVPVLYYQ